MTVLAGFTSTDNSPVLDGDLTHYKARSLIECAVLAYRDRSQIEAALDPDNLLRFQWFEAVGRAFDSQGFACIVDDHVILAFRGTQELRDFLTDALCARRPLRDFNGNNVNGRVSVHLGFQRALNGLWSNKRSARKDAVSTQGPPIDEFLKQVAEKYPESKLWLTGHSLGAALATVAAARVQLTEGAPFKDRIGALVTIGSPRVLNHKGTDKLREALGPQRIFRIYRSIDPVPHVPFRGFKHISGEQRAFVTRKGSLVMGVRGRYKWTERAAALLRTVEDTVATTLPGQHWDYSGFVSDHSSADYLKAVTEYSQNNRLRYRDILPSMAVSGLKLCGLAIGGWAVAGTTSDLATKAVVATTQLLQTGAETMLAFLR